MQLHILGTRGVPAAHGGFETFAEQLALYMVSKGHEVTVYCQGKADDSESTDFWNNVRRVNFSEPDGPLGTVRFDFRSALHAARQPGATLLTLGYNTAIFSTLFRLRSIASFMNMDGIEWRRQKWSALQRLWLRANEWCGAHFSTFLVADHPFIKQHLANLVEDSKITVIPYGEDAITGADAEILNQFGVAPGQYYLAIARPEPENSILEIVSAYTARARRFPLIILGNYKPLEMDYHAKVLAKSEAHNVIFPGAIYQQSIVRSLRYHATAYIHGHQVGGTNPSLVEALAAGNAVIAHNNVYNRWVAGDHALYFTTVSDLARHFDEVESNLAILGPMQAASRARHSLCFRRELVLEAYERLLSGESLQVPQWTM